MNAYSPIDRQSTKQALSKQAQTKAAHDLKQRRKYDDPQRWCVWFDGSARPNPGACSLGVVLRAPDGRRWQVYRDLAYGDSSYAEYQALIAALDLAKTHIDDTGKVGLLVLGDSRVVLDDVQTKQMQSITSLRHWHDMVHARLTQLRTRWPVELRWVPRHRNREADGLSRGESD